METFQGIMMEVEQPGKVIKQLHLDIYVQEVKAYIRKPLHLVRLKRVLMTPGTVLTYEDCCIVPDQHKQNNHQSFLAKLQFAA